MEDRQKCMAGKCRTGKWRTRSQGWKMQDKMHFQRHRRWIIGFGCVFSAFIR